MNIAKAKHRIAFSNRVKLAIGSKENQRPAKLLAYIRRPSTQRVSQHKELSRTINPEYAYQSNNLENTKRDASLLCTRNNVLLIDQCSSMYPSLTMSKPPLQERSSSLFKQSCQQAIMRYGKEHAPAKPPLSKSVKRKRLVPGYGCDEMLASVIRRLPQSKYQTIHIRPKREQTVKRDENPLSVISVNVEYGKPIGGGRKRLFPTKVLTESENLKTFQLDRSRDRKVALRKQSFTEIDNMRALIAGEEENVVVSLVERKMEPAKEKKHTIVRPEEDTEYLYDNVLCQVYR